jgi:transcriptional regulator with XRE-family HTH domain
MEQRRQQQIADAVRANILRIMRERDLKMTPWAEAAGLNRPFVSQLLDPRRRFNPEYLSLVRLADAARVPVESLLFPQEGAPDQADRDEIARLFWQFDAETRRLLLRIAAALPSEPDRSRGGRAAG